MKSTTIIYFTFLLLSTLTANSQITTSTGGAGNILPNSPNTNSNVGIGINNPTAKLEVNGDIKSKVGIFTNSQANGSVFTNWQDRNDKSLVLTAGALVGTGPGYINTRVFQFYDFPKSNIDAKALLYFALADRNDNNRFVFFGETDGKAMLTLNDKAQTEYFAVSEDGTGKVFQQMAKPDSKLSIGGYSDYVPGLPHKLVVQNGSALIEGNILTNESIGIGTSNFTDGAETYKLSVKGKIRAQEVKVYNTWADYVFSPDYTLPSLTEVESYIAENGHLKNVPSAKQITDHGLELGEMTKIQQEKIEELTLYLIQQNKEIEELKEQVKFLLSTKK